VKTKEVFYSQFGEDRLLSRIFRGRDIGVCIEVGANDGVTDSNTLYFEEKGWNCILIEPNSDLCQKIREIRTATLFECAASNKEGTTTLHVAEGAERSHGVSTICCDENSLNKIKTYGFTFKPVSVLTRTLDSILEETKLVEPIDFMSIDIEGHELEAFKGFSIERWMPRIIIVEDNSNFRDRTISHHLGQFGYVRFKRTGVNDWYGKKGDWQLVTLRSRFLYWLSAPLDKMKVFVAKIPGAVWLKRRIIDS
jgi:FkbM family methyltransferase